MNDALFLNKNIFPNCALEFTDCCHFRPKSICFNFSVLALLYLLAGVRTKIFIEVKAAPIFRPFIDSISRNDRFQQSGRIEIFSGARNLETLNRPTQFSGPGPIQSDLLFPICSFFSKRLAPTLLLSQTDGPSAR